jgi:hypothetical protein
MRMLLAAAVATALAAGCTTSPAAPAHQDSPARPGTASATAAAQLTRFQACRQLLAVVTHQHGRSTVPGLRRIADHVTDTRMAGDARTAVRDIDHTGAAPVALALLRDDCAHAGVKIPAP